MYNKWGTFPTSSTEREQEEWRENFGMFECVICQARLPCDASIEVATHILNHTAVYEIPDHDPLCRPIELIKQHEESTSLPQSTLRAAFRNKRKRRIVIEADEGTVNHDAKLDEIWSPDDTLELGCGPEGT